MNKSYKFKKGDPVISGTLSGTVVGIISFQGSVTGLKVELFGDKVIKIFNPEKTKVIKFDSTLPSNKYLESVLKGKQDKPAEPVKKAKTKALTVDELLDRYNDNKALYEQFGDVQYRVAMKDNLSLLELASKGVPVTETINEDTN